MKVCLSLCVWLLHAKITGTKFGSTIWLEDEGRSCDEFEILTTDSKQRLRIHFKVIDSVMSHQCILAIGLTTVSVT